MSGVGGSGDYQGALLRWINECIPGSVSALSQVSTDPSCVDLVLEITQPEPGVGVAATAANTTIDQAVRVYFQDNLNLDYDYFTQVFQEQHGGCLLFALLTTAECVVVALCRAILHIAINCPKKDVYVEHIMRLENEEQGGLEALTHAY